MLNFFRTIFKKFLADFVEAKLQMTSQCSILQNWLPTIFCKHEWRSLKHFENEIQILNKRLKSQEDAKNRRKCSICTPS